MKYRELPALCAAIYEMAMDNGLPLKKKWKDVEIPRFWTARAVVAEQAAQKLWNKPLSRFFRPSEIKALEKDQILLEEDLTNALNLMASGEAMWMDLLALRVGHGGKQLNDMLNELFDGELTPTIATN